MSGSKSLLIIEDDPDLRLTLEYFLGKIGYQVLSARNCEEGLKVLSEKRPRAVLCDIMLPGMSGYDACEKIKGDPALKDTALILISAREASEIEKKGSEAGADFYINKPVDPNDVGADLYYLFEQNFHLNSDALHRLRVTHKVPPRGAFSHGGGHGHARPPQPHAEVAPHFDSEFEFEEEPAPPRASGMAAKHTPPPAGMEALSPETIGDMNLDEVHQLLLALRDSLKDTGQRLDAILQYIEVIEE